MATSIASGALKPKAAVALSAVLNLVGAFMSTAVAATIAKGLIDGHIVTLELVFAGLVGGIVWNLLTWLLGIPSSSSHALIGGIVGATIAAVGGHGVIWKGVVSKAIIPAVVVRDPGHRRRGGRDLAGLPDHPRSPDRIAPRPGSGYGQWGSASLVSLAHGTDDAQKTMGIIFLALMSYGSISKTAAMPPLWVIVGCAVVDGARAPTWAAGGSSAPWARDWSRSSRRRAWPPNRPRPQSFCCPPTSATRCRRRRSAPVRCWAAGWASPAARCAGASPAAWRRVAGHAAAGRAGRCAHLLDRAPHRRLPGRDRRLLAAGRGLGRHLHPVAQGQGRPQQRQRRMGRAT